MASLGKLAFFLPLLWTPFLTLTATEHPTTLTNFTLYNQVLDWYSAKSLCESEGKHLVRVEDAEKHDLLKVIVQEWKQKGLERYINNSFWLDAFMPFAGVGEFLSTDCSEIPYTNWYPDDPQNLTSNRCLRLDTSSSDLFFRNDICSRSINVLCEKDLGIDCTFIRHEDSSGGVSLLGSDGCKNQCLQDKFCWAFATGFLSSCQRETMGVNDPWVPYLTGMRPLSSFTISARPILLKRCYGYLGSGSSLIPNVSSEFPRCFSSSVAESSTIPSSVPLETTTSVAPLSTSAEMSTSVESVNDIPSPSSSDDTTQVGAEATPTLTEQMPITSTPENFALVPPLTSSPNLAVGGVAPSLESGLVLASVPSHPLLTPALPSDLTQGVVQVVASLTEAVPQVDSLLNVISSPLGLAPSLPGNLPIPTISDLLQVVPSVGNPLDILKPPSPPTPSPSLCSCFCKLQPTADKNGIERADQQASSVARELAVNHSNMSMSRRKLTSASDGRKSATVIGVVGVGMMTLTCLVLAIPDVIRFVTWIQFLRRGKDKPSTGQETETELIAESQE